MEDESINHRADYFHNRNLALHLASTTGGQYSHDTETNLSSTAEKRWMAKERQEMEGRAPYHTEGPD